MNTNANSAHSGAFVIAGMTFDEESIDRVHWSSGRVAAVAPVHITVGPGVTVTVDVARPSDVLEFTIQEFGEPELLIAACETGAQALIDRAMRGDEQPPETNLTLLPQWARKAFVTGVDRWLPRPIHEGALLLDKAAAYQAVGESVAAARLLALGFPVLEALATDCSNGLLSKLTVLELADISRAVAYATAALDWGGQIRELADRIEADAGVSELDADIVLMQWSESEQLALAADVTFTETEDDVKEEVVDPAAVTARVVAWAGAQHPELHIVETADGDGVSAELRVELSDFVDDQCYEVGQVSAFVADPASGMVLRTASTKEVEGQRTLRAELSFRRPESGDVVYGIFDADKGVSAIRYLPADSDIIAVDRLLLDAWSTHRAACVAQARIADLEDKAPEQARASVSSLLDGTHVLIGSARSRLKQLQPRVERRDPSAGAVLAARLAAIDAYRDVVRTAGAVPSAGSEPLLAELLPLTPHVDLESSE